MFFDQPQTDGTTNCNVTDDTTDAWRAVETHDDTVETQNSNVETQNFASLHRPIASLQQTEHKRDAAKFKNKYRIPTARKRTWDYGSNTAYFVTICTKGRVPYFGTIDEAALDLDNECGDAVETHNHASLPSSATLFPIPESPYAIHDCTRMHMTKIGEAARQCWLAIPDHFPFVQLDAFVVMPNHVHGIIVISKHDGERDDGWHVNAFAPQSKNLASVIRGFKIGVTKFAREHGADFAWQTRYHDRIVREDDNIGLIRFYIESNPLRWANTKNDEDHALFTSPD